MDSHVTTSEVAEVDAALDVNPSVHGGLGVDYDCIKVLDVRDTLTVDDTPLNLTNAWSVG